MNSQDNFNNNKIKWFNWRVVLGVALLLLGVAYLLESIHVLTVGGLIWSLLFIVGGAIFISVLFTNRRSNWWAVIPGVILIGLGLLIAVNYLFPMLGGNIGGAIFLFAIGIAFWLVYILNVNYWWAIIPAGVNTTLGFVSLVGENPIINGGVVFFLGLGLTFGLLSILPNGGNRMSWPWIPAVCLFALAFIVSLATSTVLNYAWPVVLILAGGYLLWRTFRRSSSS